ncbi:MAG: dihydrodipicolinate synthase family protein [Candidatus Aenigmatarchaeota archaeon]
MNFEGIIPPLVTPFNENGALNEEGLKTLVNFLIEKGVGGFFICGTYGTGPAMTVLERKKTAEAVLDSAQSKAKVIVHVGSSNVDTVLELAKHAEEIGADAVATVPPFYYTYDDDTIIDFFRLLTSKVSIPVFVYNNPARSGNPIKPLVLRKLADVGVAGIKDSCFDLVRFYEFINIVDKKDFEFIIGTEAFLVPAYLVGSRACISGLSNVFPEINVKAFNLLKEGNYVEAAKVQLEIIKLRDIMHLFPAYPAIFEVLRLRGVDVGFARYPFRRLTKDEIQRLEEILRKFNIL